MSQALSFNCTMGCGACGVRLADFETSRTETLDGQLLERKTQPVIVSTCCGSSVEVWDERVEDIVGKVDVVAAS